MLELFQRNAATQDELDQADTQAETMGTTVLADKAVIENARLQLAYSYIRSPPDGVAGSLMVRAS